jgi:hypothetical protein
MFGNCYKGTPVTNLFTHPPRFDTLTSGCVIDRLIPCISEASTQDLRVAGYRLLRYIMTHPDGPQLFSNYDGKDLGWFLVRYILWDLQHENRADD